MIRSNWIEEGSQKITHTKKTLFGRGEKRSIAGELKKIDRWIDK
jgi:hypothetical protein